jgi:TPR repeat protein
MSNLGASYANGFFGVEQDYAKAREWYEKAAAEDDWSAMHNLGVLFENGLGVAQDYAKAREWYGKGAKKGDADALASLARLSIREATEAGRYDEALQLQEALAVKVEEEEKKHESKSGEETAQALSGMAWYALFAREFTKALTAADRARAPSR